MQNPIIQATSQSLMHGIAKEANEKKFSYTSLQFWALMKKS